jgi:hypothetical protein
LTYVEKFSSIIIASGQANLTSINSDLISNSEIFGHERISSVVFVEDSVSLEESSLGDSTILLFWLNKHDRLVFKVIVDDQVSNSVVLKSALNNVLFAETVESQDLFVKLNINGFKLLLDVNSTANMVGVLVM